MIASDNEDLVPLPVPTRDMQSGPPRESTSTEGLRQPASLRHHDDDVVDVTTPINAAVDRLLTCETCLNVYESRQKLRWHKQACHKPTICQYCGLTLSGRKTLRGHLRRLHPEKHEGPAPEYPCRFCDRKFKGHSSRFSHEATHKQRKFPCRVCKQYFFSGDAVRKHELTHASSSIRCTICKRLYKNESVFTDHVIRAHPTYADREGVGVYNQVSQRRTKIRGSKVERQLSVVSTEYEEAPERPLLTSDNTNRDKPASNTTTEHLITEQLVAVDAEVTEQTEAVVEASSSTLNVVLTCGLCDTILDDANAVVDHQLTTHPDILKLRIL